MQSSPEDFHRYDDILHLPHPDLLPHPRMSPENRAAQFSPFAAVVGYDAAIEETARHTDARIELEEEQKLLLNQKLCLIQENADRRPQVTITLFQPDAKKEGGAYVRQTGQVKRIDPILRQILLTDHRILPLDDVFAIEGELFRGMEDPS